MSETKTRSRTRKFARPAEGMTPPRRRKSETPSEPTAARQETAGDELVERVATQDAHEAPTVPQPLEAVVAPEEKPAPIQPTTGEDKPTPTAARPTKTALILALLRRDCGATLDELVAATGWLPHTTRAALTGLKKKGHVLTSEKFDGTRRYRVGGATA